MLVIEKRICNGIKRKRRSGIWRSEPLGATQDVQP